MPGARLKSETGWLNLAGLFWLHEGINSFGGAANNELVFPLMDVDQAGYFMLQNGKVVQSLLAGVTFTLKDSLVPSTFVVYNPDSARQPVIANNSLRWFVIKRDSKYGVRLRDLNHPNVASFQGIERFPVDARWKVTARCESTPGRTTPITNVLGQTIAQSAPCVLVFVIEGNEYRLDALDEGADELFIIFGDATNTKETYGAGRYLYAPLPDSAGMVTLDFNKSVNPPCAFTEFATCPLPPPQNVLDIAVNAGEKNYKLH